MVQSESHQQIESIKLTLSYPPRELNPNEKSHWAKKSAAVKAYRALAQAEAIAVLNRRTPPRWLHAKAKIDQYHKSTFMDRQNIIAAHKSSIDGLIDAGVLEDDRELAFDAVGRFVDKTNPRVEITITPVANGQMI